MVGWSNWRDNVIKEGRQYFLEWMRVGERWGLGQSRAKGETVGEQQSL